MKKLLFVIIILTSLFSNAQNEKLNKIDNEQLENLVEQFNIVLKKYYPNNTLGKTYEKYVADLSQRKVNPKIIKEKNTLQVYENLKKSKTFEKIWKPNPISEKRTHKINCNGDFFNYLIINTKNEDIKNSFKEFKKIENMNPSPYILLSALKLYLKENDYDDECLRKAIGVLFYYDIMMEFG